MMTGKLSPLPNYHFRWINQPRARIGYPDCRSNFTQRIDAPCVCKTQTLN